MFRSASAPHASLSADALAAVNARLERASAAERLRWAWQATEGSLVATSSFQTQSVPLLHLIATTVPELPVLFLDTGFHFPETLAFRDRLVRELGLRVRVLTPEGGHARFLRRHGELHRTDPDLCCHLNKVAPLDDALVAVDGWVAGVRRDQTAHRKHTPIVELTPSGQLKVAPVADWTQRDVWQYLHDHRLPEHPLLERGYLSVGCAPCTRAVLDGEDPRAGRWAGQGKSECGLHLPRPGDVAASAGACAVPNVAAAPDDRAHPDDDPATDA